MVGESQAQGDAIAKMSVYHAACALCEWPTAKSVLNEQGYCPICRQTMKKNGVTDAILKRRQRVYAHCV